MLLDWNFVSDIVIEFGEYFLFIICYTFIKRRQKILLSVPIHTDIRLPDASMTQQFVY